MGYRNSIIIRNQQLINYNYNLSDFKHILFCVSGRLPEEAYKEGEEGCAFCPRGPNPKERKGQQNALLRRDHQRPDPTKGWGMATGRRKELNYNKNKKKKEREVPATSAQESKEMKKVQRRYPGRKSRPTQSGCRRRTVSPTLRPWKQWRLR